MSKASIPAGKSPKQPSQSAWSRPPPKLAVKSDVTMPFGTVFATSSNNVHGKTMSPTPPNSSTTISNPVTSTASTPKPTINKADIAKLFQNSSSSSSPHPQPSPLGVYSYTPFVPSVRPPQQGSTPGSPAFPRAMTNMPNQSLLGAGPPPILASPQLAPHPHQAPPTGASQVLMEGGGYYNPVSPPSACPSLPDKPTMAHTVPHPPHVPRLPSSVSSPPPTPSTANALRLNTNVSAFVHGGHPSTKVVIKSQDGVEVTLDALKKYSFQPPIVPIPSVSPIVTSRRITSIRIESEEAKRLRTDALRKEQDKKKREEEEEAERKRTAEEEEWERIRKEEAAAEKECLRREEEERFEAQRKEEEGNAHTIWEEEEQKQKDVLGAEEAQLEADEADDIVETASPVNEPQCSKDGEVLDTGDLPKPQPNSCSEKKAKKTLRIVTFSVPPLSKLSRRRPDPLDLASAKRDVSAPPPSALLTARAIENLSEVKYPEGIQSPRVELNANSKDGRFRYDRDFLLQFMLICKEKPPALPLLDALGIKPVDQSSFSMALGGPGRHRNPSNIVPPSVCHQSSVGLGPGGFQKSSTPNSFPTQIGNFHPFKLPIENRFALSSDPPCTSVGSATMQFAQSPMVGSPSQGGPDHPVGSKRTRTKRGEKRHGSRNATMSFKDQSEVDSSEIVEREVKALLDQLTIEMLDSISDQIVQWMNKSKDTLAQVIRLVLEKATETAALSEMYARLCWKMMRQISPEVQDDGYKDMEGKPIASSQLFRKYLIKRCQHDLKHGWFNKAATNTVNETKGTEKAEVYSYYSAAQDAKRRCFNLIKFFGEVFKLQMLTERIMHECVKKLLINVEYPEEEQIETLCQLLKTVGQLLDTAKARVHIDVYFMSMKQLGNNPDVSVRMQSMLQDVIELRERKWVSRNVIAVPMTIAAVHEAATKDRLAAEKESFSRQASMSRGGSRHFGGERNQEFGLDDWAVAGGSVSRPPPNPKAGDLSQFGKISRGAPMVMGPSSVFAGGKKDIKRESLSTNSSPNMFHMLSQNPELTPEASTKHGLLIGGKPSLDCGQTETKLSMWNTFDQDPEALALRKKLDLLPRFKPSVVEPQGSIKRRMGGHVETFFILRDPEEARVYFTTLPKQLRFQFVIKLVAYALKTDEADARLVSNFFVQAASNGQCTLDDFEKGFMPMAGRLDQYATNFQDAYYRMALMLKGAGFENEPKRLKRIVSKLEDSDRLVSHLSLRPFQ